MNKSIKAIILGFLCISLLSPLFSMDAEGETQRPHKKRRIAIDEISQINETTSPILSSAESDGEKEEISQTDEMTSTVSAPEEEIAPLQMGLFFSDLPIEVQTNLAESDSSLYERHKAGKDLGITDLGKANEEVNLKCSSEAQNLERTHVFPLMPSHELNLSSLAPELKVHIFRYLPPPTLAILSQVSKKLYDFSQDRQLLFPLFNSLIRQLQALKEAKEPNLKGLDNFIACSLHYWESLYKEDAEICSLLSSPWKFLGALSKFSKTPPHILQSLSEVYIDSEIGLKKVLLLALYENHLFSKSMRTLPKLYPDGFPLGGFALSGSPLTAAGLEQTESITEQEDEKEEYTSPPQQWTQRGIYVMPVDWTQERNSFINYCFNLSLEHLEVISRHSYHLFSRAYNKKSRQTIIEASVKLTPEKLEESLSFLKEAVKILPDQEKTLAPYKAQLIEAYDKLPPTELTSRLNAIKTYAPFLFKTKELQHNAYRFSPILKACLELPSSQIEIMAIHTSCFDCPSPPFCYDEDINSFLLKICRNLNSEQVSIIQKYSEDLHDIYTAEEECEKLMEELPPEWLTFIASHRDDLFPEERQYDCPSVLESISRLTTLDQLKVIVSYSNNLFFRWMHGRERGSIIESCSKFSPGDLTEYLVLIDNFFSQDERGEYYEDQDKRCEFIQECLNLSPEKLKSSIIASNRMCKDCCSLVIDHKEKSIEQQEDDPIYQRFLKGVLIYRPYKKSDVGRIDLPIASLSNPLEGTFDLSGCGKAEKYLSISTGYRKEKKAENTKKLEIWLTPRFLVEKEIEGNAQHFKAIFPTKWPEQAPIGLFWTCSDWEDMGWYDYLTTNSINDLEKDNLYAKWDARDGGTDIGAMGRSVVAGNGSMVLPVSRMLDEGKFYVHFCECDMRSLS